jgi:hypothetical protein
MIPLDERVAILTPPAPTRNPRSSGYLPRSMMVLTTLLSVEISRALASTITPPAISFPALLGKPGPHV